MAQRIQLRRDTVENWQNVDPVIAKGEVSLAYQGDTMVSMRIGNGVNVWSALTPMSFFPGELHVTDDATEPPDADNGHWWLHP